MVRGLAVPCLAVLLTWSAVVSSCTTETRTGDYTLTILHVNDVHARFEETNKYGGNCGVKDKATNKCYGGFARIHSAVKGVRACEPNTVFLAAGDYFQGTVWYTLHKYKAVAHFLNIIKHDAMSFGNHEFDDGIHNTVSFLDIATFPVLACNIDDTLEPTIKGKYSKSVVLTKGGRKIGIVGYLTTETLKISNPGKLIITDEITAVRTEAQRLKKLGVDIIIGLGHAGYTKDIQLAMDVDELDVVVGGHTNTFLYTGTDPSSEKSVGSYPHVVTRADGRQVPVVQAYAFGKYLGRLDVTFNSKGEAISWKGNPMLLDNTVTKDPFVLSELVPWKTQMNALITKKVGKTYVFLDGTRPSCRMRECNLGNLQTDAMIHMNTKYPDDLAWTRTSLAVVNSGGIRGSIDERDDLGTITMQDILQVSPFQNTIDIVELAGRYVKEMFEFAVSTYDPADLDPSGKLLQVAGFIVVYDITKPVGSRVVRLQARCSTCRVPQMKDVQDATVYQIAMISYMANGGGGYKMIKTNKIKHHLTGLLDTDVFSQYIKITSPVYQGLEGRIQFVDSKAQCPCTT